MINQRSAEIKYHNLRRYLSITIFSYTQDFFTTRGVHYMDNVNKELEKEELEKAAETLLHIDFDQNNYKELIEIINAIKKISENKKEIENSKTGIPYITENENMFIAPEGLNTEDFEKIAAQTDISFFKEELEKLSYDEGDDWEYKQKILDQRYNLQKKIDELSLKLPHEEEIERKEAIEELEPIYDEEEITSESDKDTSKDPKPIVFGKTVLPAFALLTDKGLRNFENAKVLTFDEKTNTYLLENGIEKLFLPKETFETILNPNYELKKMEKENPIHAEKGHAIVTGATIIPEFAMITSHGLQTFKDMKLEKYNEAENSYTIGNGNSSVILRAETFNEVISPERFEKQFDEKVPEHEKLIKSQYEDFFKQRDNTVYNFRHNFGVYCRKEASSPLDAVQIAKEITSRMDKDEKQKTYHLLKQMAKEDETITQVLVRTYLEAVKEVPLNEEYIKNNQSEKMIARPFYDTISDKGQLVDKDSTLRVGDTIHNMAFNVDKVFGSGKDKVYENLTVVSSSKEGNKIVLMDKDKSFYEVPRDTLLEGYNKQQEKQHKAEVKQQRKNRIDIER